MAWSVELFCRIRWGFYTAASAVLIALVALVAQTPGAELRAGEASLGSSGSVSPTLAEVAAKDPARRVEVIVQAGPEAVPADVRYLVRNHGGRVTGDLHVIRGVAARMAAGAAERIARDVRVKAVSLNAPVKQNSIDPADLATSYNQSLKSDKVWSKQATGKGVGVAVIDTGIAGDLPDFRISQDDSRSRVIASAVTNPHAETANDTYGHGTHVAGIIAGNGANRPPSDPLHGEYVGVAPDADLISIKASDDKGEATVLDVIYGLQFAVDFKHDYNIRVVNMSLESSVAESYRTDPLDAAVESAWFNGIVVVAAAGNRGSASDAVSYAPANDPYVISVGAVDDQGTKTPGDDELASWSSRGRTQDGFAKPELVAPGAHIVSLLSPSSSFASECPSCIVSEQYIRAGGTSMSAPMVSGLVADMLQVHPSLTPDEVKSILMDTARSVSDVGAEAFALPAVNATGTTSDVNAGLQPNEIVDPATGEIDYTRSRWSRSRWSRSRWSTAPESLGASWARSRWSCDCSRTESGSIDPARSRWSRSRWSMSFNK